MLDYSILACSLMSLRSPERNEEVHPLRPLPGIPQGIAPDATTGRTHSGAACEKDRRDADVREQMRARRAPHRRNRASNILPGLWFEPEAVRFHFGEGHSEWLIVSRNRW